MSEYATGGIVPAGRLFLVGEPVPDIWVLPKGMILPREHSAGEHTVILEPIHIASVDDIDAALEELHKRMVGDSSG